MTFPSDHGSDDFEDPALFGERPEDEKGVRGFVPEFVRKMAVTGLGALFMTEEGIRSLASQLKLPKEALGFIVSQAEKTKDDVTRVLSEELRRFFQSEKLRDEFLRLLAGMTIEIKAEVRLVPDKAKSTEGASPSEPDLPRSKKEGPPRVVITELNPRRARKKKD